MLTSVPSPDQAATAPQLRQSRTLPAAPPRRVVLTGFMGSGKTTVGRLLAARLGWTLLDLDTVIAARAGRSIPEIFAHDGELAFRRLETQALASALATPDTILALGGGATEILTNRLLLEQTPATAIVFLQAPFGTLYDRCILQALDPAADARPNLADPALAERRFLDRQLSYQRLAHSTISTADHTPEDIAAAIALQLLRC